MGTTLRTGAEKIGCKTEEKNAGYALTVASPLTSWP